MKKTSKQKQISEREWLEFSKQHLWLCRLGVCRVIWNDPDAEPRIKLEYSWNELDSVLNLKNGKVDWIKAIYDQAQTLCLSAEKRGGLSGHRAFVRLDQARLFLLENYCDAERILIAGRIWARGLDGELGRVEPARRPTIAWSISIEEKKLTAHPNVPSSFVGLLRQAPTGIVVSSTQIPEIKPGTQVKIEIPERSIAWDYAGWAIVGLFFGAMVIGPLLWR